MENRLKDCSFFRRRYLWNWATGVIIFGLCFIKEALHPVSRYIRMDDESLSHPIRHGSISTFLLYLISVIFPLFSILLYNLLWYKSLHDIHHSYMAFFNGMVVTRIVTEGTKLLWGEPRPTFLAHCRPILDPSNSYICTGPQSDVNDALKATFSGHASYSMFGLLFFSLYMAGKLGIWSSGGINRDIPSSAHSVRYSDLQMISKNNTLGVTPSNAVHPFAHSTAQTHAPFTDPEYNYALIVLFFIPIYVSIYIGITRITEGEHFWYNVVVGWMVGGFFAVLYYRSCYHSIFEAHAAIRSYPKGPVPAPREENGF